MHQFMITLISTSFNFNPFPLNFGCATKYKGLNTSKVD